MFKNYVPFWIGEAGLKNNPIRHTNCSCFIVHSKRKKIPETGIKGVLNKFCSLKKSILPYGPKKTSKTETFLRKKTHLKSYLKRILKNAL